jgi:hypothetical protein
MRLNIFSFLYFSWWAVLSGFTPATIGLSHLLALRIGLTALLTRETLHRSGKKYEEFAVSLQLLDVCGDLRETLKTGLNTV